MLAARGAGRHHQDLDTSNTTRTGKQYNEGQRRDVQGHDNVASKNKAEGRGRRETYKAEGAGIRVPIRPGARGTRHARGRGRVV